MEKRFLEYVFSFYGPNEMYGDFFKNTLTKQELFAAINLFQRKGGKTFLGDTFDREIVRDILLTMRGVDITEYNVSKYFN